MTDLGTLGGDSFGEGINKAGQVTGYFFTPNGTAIHAFLYSNGQMMDLNDLIDPALHITLDDARAINDNGQIVASNGSNGHDYLLTPVPEPGTWALLCVSGLMLAAWRQNSLVRSRVRTPNS